MERILVVNRHVKGNFSLSVPPVDAPPKSYQTDNLVILTI